MREFALLLVFGLANAASAQTPAPQTPSVTVEKMAIGTGIKDRELQGEAVTFDAAIGRIYCWTRLKGATLPAAVKHVWHLDGKKVFEISLPVNFPRTRTWSTKSVRPGAWKVEVLTESGEVLQSVEFTVTKAGGQP